MSNINKKCKISVDKPIIRNAPQILYGSVFPDKKGRLAGLFETKKNSIKVYQGASDFFLGSGEDLKCLRGMDLDFEVELAIIVDAVPMGVPVVDADKYIQVLTACNDFTYRSLASIDKASGFGFIQSKPLTSFCSCGILPLDNKAVWNNGLPVLDVSVLLNGKIFCEFSTVDMLYSFSELIAYCARTRDLPTGTVITSGAVSTFKNGSLSDGCIAERIMCAPPESSISTQNFLQDKDIVQVDFYQLGDGRATCSESIFGSLVNRVVMV
ncbi:fumarylacetoacetate hydrolase family protein [Pseudomonas sp. HY13-MNA-CIBAN-0226]|uniref:fumarylacetoacetate hydrolase family protein n=1 Tax=Pseudomonas sp. HY13-MNA-CIBAN-0226 TaxID=3140473 RepID=UPI0033179D5B